MQLFVILLEHSSFKSQVNFKLDVFPQLKTLIHGKEMSAQALYLIINKIDVFSALLSKQEMQDHFLPLFIKSYDCGVAKLQIQAIQKTSVGF